MRPNQNPFSGHTTDLEMHQADQIHDLEIAIFNRIPPRSTNCARLYDSSSCSQKAWKILIRSSISQCVTKRPTFVILFSFHFRFVLILIKTSRDGEQRSFAYFSSDWKYRWLIKDDGLIFLAGIRSDVWEGRMMKMSMTQGSKGTTPISLLLDMAALSQVGCVSSESEKLILKYTTNSIIHSRLTYNCASLRLNKKKKHKWQEHGVRDKKCQGPLKYPQNDPSNCLWLIWVHFQGPWPI